MFFWFSDGYRRKFPENVALAEGAARKALRSDELLHGILRLCGLKPWTGVWESMDFLSDRFVPKRTIRKANEN